MMIEAYKDFWQRYAVFNGRSTRKQYWLAILGNYLIIIPLLILTLVLEDEMYDVIWTGLVLFLIFYSLAMVIPNIAITVRRLRDGGCSPYCYFLNFIPFFGSLIMFVLMLIPSIQNETEQTIMSAESF